MHTEYLLIVRRLSNMMIFTHKTMSFTIFIYSLFIEKKIKLLIFVFKLYKVSYF